MDISTGVPASLHKAGGELLGVRKSKSAFLPATLVARAAVLAAASTGALDVLPASLPRLATAPVQRNNFPYPRHSFPAAVHLLQCGYDWSHRSRCRRQLWQGLVGGLVESMAASSPGGLLYLVIPSQLSLSAHLCSMHIDSKDGKPSLCLLRFTAKCVWAAFCDRA